MLCPFCVDKHLNTHNTKVLDSRSFWDPNRKRFYVERRRVCSHCEKRFSTTEYSPVAQHLITTIGD